MVAGDEPLSVQLPEPNQWPYQDNLLFRHWNPEVAKRCHYASDCLHRWRFSPATLVLARGLSVSLLLKPEVGHPRAGAGSENAPHSQRYETILKQTPNGEEDPLVGSREHLGILFSSKMEQSTDTHNTDESPRQHVEQKKPGRKRGVLHDSARERGSESECSLPGVVEKLGTSTVNSFKELCCREEGRGEMKGGGVLPGDGSGVHPFPFYQERSRRKGTRTGWERNRRPLQKRLGAGEGALDPVNDQKGCSGLRAGPMHPQC